MECSRKGQWRHIIGWSKLKGISMYTQSLPGGSPYQPACRNKTKNWHKQQICSLWWECGIFVNSVFCGHNHRLGGAERSCDGAGPSPITSFIRPLSHSHTERRELLHVLNRLNAFFSSSERNWSYSRQWNILLLLGKYEKLILYFCSRWWKSNIYFIYNSILNYLRGKIDQFKRLYILKFCLSKNKTNF